MNTTNDEYENSPYSKLDFLIGEWDVAAKTFHNAEVIDQTKAIWKARHVDNKRMIVDQWKSIPKKGEVAQYYRTLRTYSESIQRWQIVGLQSHQPTLTPVFLGKWTDNEMHMTAEVIVEQGPLQARVRFFDITENRFEWEMKMSIDGEVWHMYQASSARRIK